MVQCVRTLIRKGPKNRFPKPTYKPVMFNQYYWGQRQKDFWGLLAISLDLSSVTLTQGTKMGNDRS